MRGEIEQLSLELDDLTERFKETQFQVGFICKIFPCVRKTFHSR